MYVQSQLYKKTLARKTKQCTKRTTYTILYSRQKTHQNLKGRHFQPPKEQKSSTFTLNKRIFYTLEGMTNLFTTHTPSQEQQWNISCSLPPLSTLMPLQVHKIICSFQDPRQSVQPTPNTKGHVSPHSILDKVIHILAISSHMKQTEKMIRPTRYKKLCKNIQFYLEGQSILIT